MTDYTTLPLEAHDNRSVFLEHAWNVGRAYRNQALGLISICQLLSRTAAPALVHEDGDRRRMLQVCDLAFRSAADSGTKVTDEANARFTEATRVLSSHSLRWYHLMELAHERDSVERDWSPLKSDEWGRTMTVNFVLLKSPLLSPHDTETVTVSQELSADPSFPEILWNFSRYNDRARITLEQNPHFYLRCPEDESAYTPVFQRRPLQEPSGVLEHNDTIYVLFDRPSRVFLDTWHNPRIFGNVWSLNGSLIFRDSSGVIEGEELVRDSSMQDKLWYYEQPVSYSDYESRPRLNHSYLRHILTTPSVDRSTDGEFEDWKVLSRPASHSLNIYICISRGSLASTSSLDLPPLPPTSRQPRYRVLYTTINTLDDDILLGIFNYYRLDEENSWNVRLGWRKLSHVCQRWHHLIFSSAFHLGMHIQCTNGTPVVDTLDHLPPLPLFVDYWDATGNLRMEDELGIHHALLLRNRVRSINLHFPPSILNGSLVLLDGPFPILEYLSLSFSADEITTLTLPKTFLAPNLCHLSLGIGLPKRLRLLSSTVSLVTLVIKNIGAFGYFHPRLLVARLQSLPQLEDVSIGFSIPIPRPSAERELFSKQGTPVTLPNLRILTFRGVSAYMECLVAQIRAPLLERLDITLFNQIAFALPHLSHFINITEGLKFPTAVVFFDRDGVSITTGHRSTPWLDRPFSLWVRCNELDWQIDCSAQICSMIIPALSGVGRIELGFHEETMPTKWQNGEIDGTTWHELLRSFNRTKELHICGAFMRELSRALELDDVVSDPGLLPDLQELLCGYSEVQAASLFGSFIHAREVAGRPVRLSPLVTVPSLRFNGYGEYSGLLYHSPHALLYEDELYPTALHLFEALKFLDHRPDLADQIRLCEYVEDVTGISASFADHTRRDWGDVGLATMDEVLYLKFRQHGDLRQLLIGSYPAELIYVESGDVFWGDGGGTGLNELGKSLMRVRERIRTELSM